LFTSFIGEFIPNGVVLEAKEVLEAFFLHWEIILRKQQQ